MSYILCCGKDYCILTFLVFLTFSGYFFSILYHDFLRIYFLTLVFFQWTPEGRRLITGASSGEFTLWNGLTFNFETILQV